MKSELDFIKALKQRSPSWPPVSTGIGDDGAVLTNADGSETVVVTDMLLDGVHFDLAKTSPEMVGRKAVAVNLSDVAAMGCRPTAAFVSVAVPGLAQSSELLDALYNGIQGLSEQFEFTVAGGDTNSWDGPFAINVCMTGTPCGDHAVLRSGAQPGDSLLVTGALGGSLASGRHLSFMPRLETVRLLATRLTVHAMMDISDGLSIDLHRMMDASGVGAKLVADKIPVHEDVSQALSSHERLIAALADGEDFELLIALPADEVESSLQLPGADLTLIGTVTAERECRIIDAVGCQSDLAVSGWQHE